MIAAYSFIRVRTAQRLRRLPSDHHELTLQGPIMEVVSKGLRSIFSEFNLTQFQFLNRKATVPINPMN